MASQDNDGSEKVEQVETGVSITTKMKRGTGTRDQDEWRVWARGETPEEAVEDLRDTLDEIFPVGDNDRLGDQVRNFQPERSDTDEEDA